MRPLRPLVLTAMLLAAPAAAHDTGRPHSEPPGWTLDPGIVAPLLVSATLFAVGWWRLRGCTRRSLAALDIVAALGLVATSIVSGALGALMTFATSPWYAGYARLGTAPFGLPPAEDQQLAGLLMWGPGGLVHAGAALLLMRRLRTPAHA